MISLLIADDEKIIRESIANCLDWKSMGIRVVACCANGIEALESSIDDSPNIVLTDIKMPGLSGLELIERIQAINPDTEFIVLSGFREFDFAKRAIELGVRRYLLKPVSEEQVCKAVTDALKSCREKRSVQDSLSEHIRLREQMKHFYRQQVQYSLFLHSDSFNLAVDTYMNQYVNENATYLLLNMDCSELDEAKRLCKLTSDYFRSRSIQQVTNYIYASGQLSGVFQLPPKAEIKNTKESLYMTFHSEDVSLAVYFDKSLRSLLLKLRLDFFSQSDVYTINSTGQHNCIFSTSHALNTLTALPDQLIRSINEGQNDLAENLLMAYLGPIHDIAALRLAGAQLISGIMLKKQLIETDHPTCNGVFDSIYLENDPGALLKYIVVKSLLLLDEKENNNDTIHEVKLYVKNNLGDSSLSLKKIAAEVIFVHVDYLSRLFVSKTGERFSHYLNRCRVERAKQLLSDDTAKIYQVAEKVGLGHNPRYFAQVFKKYTGETPTKFSNRQNVGQY